MTPDTGTNTAPGKIVAPKIEIEGLNKAFGPNQVLNDLTLSVGTRESLVIIGGSGTGKSVLLKCILGLLRPDSGSINVDGQSAMGLNDREQEELSAKFGMLFQGAALFDSLPIWENVAFGLLATKAVKRRAAREKAIHVLRQVGLGADVADLSPAELSGGMQKRVGLARAIAAEPEIIFFDEPTTGLDPIMADVINDLIVDRVRDLGATTITITHDMASLRKIADRVAMLYKGKLVWTGTKAELDETDNPYVQQFINGRAEGPIQMELLRA